MNRPTSVKTFFFLYMMSIGMAIAPIIRVIVMIKPDHRVFISIFSVFLYSLLAWFAYKVYLGSNGFRVVLTFLIGAGSLTILAGPSVNATVPPIPAVEWTQFVLQLTGVALLYVKSSRDWFAVQESEGH